MTETNSQMPEYVFHDGRFSVGPLSLKISRIVAVFVVAVVVATIWLRAGWEIDGIISKLLSVVLLADVLFTPSLISSREKRFGKRVESSVFTEMGYRWLVTMATLIIVSRIR